MPATLVIADDHEIIRDGLRALFARGRQFVVVGEAGDGRSLVQLVRAKNPDLVLTDLAMPGGGGLEAVRQLRADGFARGIVVLSHHGDGPHLRQAFGAGADAYVLKDCAFKQVVAALTAAARRERWVSPEIAALLAATGSAPDLENLLTPRELEVLKLIGAGLATKDLAARMGISPKTVDVHRMRLMTKLKVDNQVALARVALREGLAQI